MVEQSAKVFIDGEAGTVGLGIRQRLASIDGVEVVSLPPEKRKDAAARRDIYGRVDLAILCLPDDAAKEAVALANELPGQGPKLIDASTAHRVAADWVYGFAELIEGQADRIRASRRVTNPGCYSTGALALLRPLVAAGVLPPDYPITINAVSGYTGGGKSMIADFESGAAAPFKLYGLTLEHKHMPEIQHYAGLTRRAIFVPSVGNFAQGMLVSIPLHLDALPRKPTAGDLEAVLRQHYGASDRVVVRHADDDKARTEIDAVALRDTDQLELWVYGNEKHRQAVLVARLDNLGKGASGAAVQNLRLMLAR
jgi:N-acetyl-gamma-glutamyl-phosphate reductase